MPTCAMVSMKLKNKRRRPHILVIVVPLAGGNVNFQSRYSQSHTQRMVVTLRVSNVYRLPEIREDEKCPIYSPEERD
jgi:hypothetical protein